MCFYLHGSCCCCSSCCCFCSAQQLHTDWFVCAIIETDTTTVKSSFLLSRRDALILLVSLSRSRSLPQCASSNPQCVLLLLCMCAYEWNSSRVGLFSHTYLWSLSCSLSLRLTLALVLNAAAAALLRCLSALFHWLLYIGRLVSCSCCPLRGVFNRKTE